MLNKSSKQTGSAHVIIITIVVIVILGGLGFVFWNNFLNKKDTSQQNSQQTTQEKDIKPKSLNIQPLGKTLNLESAPYDDITYTQTSVNVNDANKYVVAIYSKDLNSRLVSDAMKNSNGVDLSVDYWKYSANRAVYAYYYNPSTNSNQPSMIDGVADNIINPEQRDSTSKFYVGFMGPGVPNSKDLSSENMAFKDWVVNNLK